MGDTVLFAGGGTNGSGENDTAIVQIYHPSTNSWTTGALSAPGTAAGFAVDGRIYFVGVGSGSDGGSATVNEYDPASGTWQTGSLSGPLLDATAVAAGPLGVVLNYDNGVGVTMADFLRPPSPNSFSTDRLRHGPYAPAGASVGDLAVFADIQDSGDLPPGDLRYYDPLTAGWSKIAPPDDVDFDEDNVEWGSVGPDFIITTFKGIGIYDTITQRWSEVTMPAGLSRVGSLDGSFSPTVGGNILFAEKYVLGGGLGNDNIATDLVVAFNPVTKTWSATDLSSVRSAMGVTAVGPRAFFAGGIDYSTGTGTDQRVVDIFTDKKPQPILDGGVAARSGGKAIVSLTNSGDADFAGPYTIEVYATQVGQTNGSVKLGSLAVTKSLPYGGTVQASISLSNFAKIGRGTFHLVAVVKAANGTVTPFAGGTEDFRVHQTTTPAAIARPAVAFSVTPITGDSADHSWLKDAGERF